MTTYSRIVTTYFRMITAHFSMIHSFSLACVPEGTTLVAPARGAHSAVKAETEE